MKGVQIRSFFWSVFSRFQTEYGEIRSISRIQTEYGERLNTERYSVSLRIQSEYGKIRTRKNSVFGHFSRSVGYRFQVVDIDAQPRFRYGRSDKWVFEKFMFHLERGILWEFLAWYDRINLKFEQAVRRFTIVYLNKAAKLSILQSFSSEVPLMASLIDKAALYWNNSNFWWKL